MSEIVKNLTRQVLEQKVYKSLEEVAWHCWSNFAGENFDEDKVLKIGAELIEIIMSSLYPTEPTYTQSQVEAIMKADRERLIKEVDDWLCDCKKLQPYVLEHHHFNCALGYALIRIRTTPIEIGEGE